MVRSGGRVLVKDESGSLSDKPPLPCAGQAWPVCLEELDGCAWGMKGLGEDMLAWLVCSSDSWISPSCGPAGWGRAMEIGTEYLLLACTWPLLSLSLISGDVLPIGDLQVQFTGKRAAGSLLPLTAEVVLSGQHL